MAQSDRFDALVLGSGEGGKYLAWHLARSGQRVAVIERRLIGGSCPNTNCLPSKNEIWSAKVAHLAQHARQFGTTTGPVGIDMDRVRQRKREMVDGLIATNLDLYRSSGASLVMGEGQFAGPSVLEVRLNEGGTRLMEADRIFINVGTHGTIPPVPGLAEARPMTNIEALELGELPAHLIVLGGGYVGLELAQAYRRFGSRVTILEHGPQLVSREDPDVAAEIQDVLGREGIEIQGSKFCFRPRRCGSPGSRAMRSLSPCGRVRGNI